MLLTRPYDRRAFAPSALMAIDGAPSALLDGAPSARHLDSESLAEAARVVDAGNMFSLARGIADLQQFHFN